MHKFKNYRVQHLVEKNTNNNFLKQSKNKNEYTLSDINPNENTKNANSTEDSTNSVIIDIWHNISKSQNYEKQKEEHNNCINSLNFSEFQNKQQDKLLLTKSNLPENENKLITKAKVNDEFNHFNPKFYTFRIGSPTHDPSNYKAIRPPNWLLFDHTIAIIWFFFSPNTKIFKDPNISQLEWTLEFLNSTRIKGENSLSSEVQNVDMLIRCVEDRIINIYASQSSKNSHPDKNNIKLTSSYIVKKEKNRGPQPPPTVVRKTFSKEESKIGEMYSIENLLENYNQFKDVNPHEFCKKLEKLREFHVANIAHELIKLQNVELIMDQVFGPKEYVRYSNKENENILQEMLHEINK